MTAELETTEPIVTLTPTAIVRVKRQAQRMGTSLESAFLRLGVRGGGCSGLSYVIDFETEPDPEFDLVYSQDDIHVVVDIKSAKFLKGSALNYDLKNLTDGGFVFENPNAVRSCGCGTSFTAK